MKRLILSLVISIFIISLSYGEYVMKWTNRYDSGMGNDTALDMAIDSIGNIYLTGIIKNASSDICTIYINNLLD